MDDDKKKFSKTIQKIIPVICIVIIGLAAYHLISIQRGYEEANDEYDSLMIYAVAAEPTVEPTTEPAVGDDLVEEEILPEEAGPVDDPSQYPAMSIDYESLQAINEDYRAWLELPALEVSYPVVCAEDNDHYLHYTFEGNRNGAGCLFIDYENASDFSDPNTFIYGHNMRNGSMFGCLKKFRQDASLCEQNPYFYLYTQDRVYKYEIFAYYTAEYDSDRYMLITSDEEYDYYVETALDFSEYVLPHEFDFSERPNIVTLSTCSGTVGGTTRLVVHGVLVGEYLYPGNRAEI